MSIKILSLIFSTLSAAAFGWFSVNRFVSIHGWNDPVTGWIILSLIIWVFLTLVLQYLAHWFDPLRQIETTGTLLYRDDKGRVSYQGLYFDEENRKDPLPLASKFRLRDLFRRYVSFPLMMKFDLKIILSVSQEAIYHLEVKDFQINLFISGQEDGEKEKAMEIFKRYKNPHLTYEEMREKLTGALLSAASAKIITKNDSVEMLDGIRHEFKCRVEGVMRTELYSAYGDDFKLSAHIEYK